MHRDKLKPAFILGVVLAGAAAGWYWLQGGKPESPVLTLYGNIDIRQVELSFRDQERIAEILVQEGQRVQRGQLLAVQALERFQYAVDSANAKRDLQQHIVDKLRRGSRPQEITLAANQVKAAQAELVLAKKELARVQNLAERKLAAASLLDQARARYDSARENTNALQQQYQLAAIGPRQEDIQAAEAQLRADRASAQLAQKAWEDGHLYAPQDGVVQNRILEPGDMANGQTPVLTLALPNPVWARVYVPESALGKLRDGMPAEIGSDSFPDKAYAGWLGYVSPSAEFTPKSVETEELRTSLVYQARIYACNDDQQLRLGMPVTVTLDTGKAARDQACPSTQ